MLPTDSPIAVTTPDAPWVYDAAYVGCGRAWASIAHYLVQTQLEMLRLRTCDRHPLTCPSADGHPLPQGGEGCERRLGTLSRICNLFWGVCIRTCHCRTASRAMKMWADMI